MLARNEEKSIIDIRLLAEQLDLSPEETQMICRRLFWKIAEAQGAFGQEVRAVAEGSNIDESTARVLAELLARDMRKPIPPAKETLAMRASEVAENAREKMGELKDRVSKGVSSIDVGSLREDGAVKVAELRERAANVDVGEIADQAKELGGKATSEMQGLVERVRGRFKRSERIEPTAELEG